MSKVSQYIEGHIDFLNVLLPFMKILVDASPLPANDKAIFDQIYAKAPAVITAGASAVQELTGHAQPAANELAGAFTGQGVDILNPVTRDVVATMPPPAPSAPVIAPPPMMTAPPPPPLATVLTAPPPPLPGVMVTPPAPAPIFPAEVPTPADLGATVDASELARLAASLGLSLIAPNGQPVTF